MCKIEHKIWFKYRVSNKLENKLPDGSNCSFTLRTWLPDNGTDLVYQGMQASEAKN